MNTESMAQLIQARIEALRAANEQDPNVLRKLHLELNAAFRSKQIRLIEYVKLDDALIQLYPSRRAA